MPHKRAKRSIREQEKALRGADLAPKSPLEHEPIPKSVSRVLEAGRIRREFREMKRKLDGDNDESKPHPSQRKKIRHDDVNSARPTKALTIKPGETVAHFNKRVESTMLPLIKTARQHSSVQARKVLKEEAAQEALQRDEKIIENPRQHPETSKRSSFPPAMPGVKEDSVKLRKTAEEFLVTSTSAPRRLNDIAQEPPEIRKFPRGATTKDRTSGVLTMAQRAMMEEEREKAITRYRELKARKLRDGSGVTLRRVGGSNTEGPS
ncbi:hypothetical protein BU15DRAFT_52306 [Melanogaster broomeanus]|nr:hypothetical protein BU15DRAFT_52306 [Melanogaster broomeanus]